MKVEPNTGRIPPHRLAVAFVLPSLKCIDDMCYDNDDADDADDDVDDDNDYEDGSQDGYTVVGIHYHLANHGSPTLSVH